jgi:hypothetical protein
MPVRPTPSSLHGFWAWLQHYDTVPQVTAPRSRSIHSLHDAPRVPTYSHGQDRCEGMDALHCWSLRLLPVLVQRSRQ